MLGPYQILRYIYITLKKKKKKKKLETPLIDKTLEILAAAVYEECLKQVKRYA
jgi:hypothetical protein